MSFFCPALSGAPVARRYGTSSDPDPKNLQFGFLSPLAQSLSITSRVSGSALIGAEEMAKTPSCQIDGLCEFEGAFMFWDQSAFCLFG